MSRQTLTVNSNANGRLPDADRRLLRTARLYFGIYSRVARRMKREVSHVRQVALGMRRSKRVEQALLREIKRLNKLASKAA